MNIFNRYATGIFIFILLGTLSPAGAQQPCGNNAPNMPASKNNEQNPNSQGDPYNPYTGNEFREIPDLKIWGGVGQHQLTFGRWANSRFVGGTQYLGSGHNWRHSYQWDIADAGPSSSGSAEIEIIAPEGSDTIFVQNSTTPTTWNPLVGTPELLTQSGSDFYLQRKDGFQYHIVKHLNADGSDYYLMTDFQDTQGNDYVLTYNTAHEVTRVTEPGGRYLQINYTALSVNKVNFTTLATITVQPPPDQYSTVTVTDTHAYRYLRYLSADGGYCNAAEIQFYDTSGNLLTGTPFGSGPPWSSSGGFANAFDGDTTNTVDDSHASGGFCGIDLGAGNSAVVGSIRYYPRAGFAYRMLPNPSWEAPARFQGSNQQPVTTDAIASVTSSDGRTVSYQYTSFNDPTLPTGYQTLTSVNYDDGTQATYTYQQVFPSTPPLAASFVDPRYKLPFTQSKSVYYTGFEQAMGEINQQLNPATGEAVSTLTSQSWSQPIVTSGNGAVRNIAMSDSIGTYQGLTDGAGASTSVEYDSLGYRNAFHNGLGRVTRTTNSPFAHPVLAQLADSSTRTTTRDNLDLPLAMTDELGHTVTISRDSAHRPVAAAYPDGSSEAYTYNGFGQPLTHTQRNGGVGSAVYDSTGLKTSSTDALGHVTHYTYDSMGRLATMTDANSHTTSYQYNAKGQVTQITYADSSTHSYTYDTFGNKLTDMDELGHTTIYTYDIYNRCTSITDALGHVTQFVFRSGYWTTKPDKMIEPSGKATAYTYDGENHLLTQTVGYGTADATTTTYAYDADYNVTSMTDGNGHAWTYTYDSRDRKTSQTDPLGHTTSYGYDAASNVITVTRPDGGVTTNVYDTMHRLTQTTDPKGEVTKMTYDASGNLLTTTDPKNNTYTFTYDLLNRKTSLTYPDGSHESYGYDAVGNLATYVTRAGQTKTSTFDNRNREVSYTWSDGVTPNVSRTYDVAGRLLTSANGVSTSTYAYDNANRLTGETEAIAGLGSSLPVTYSYDADGNRTGVTYPSGTAVSYGYTNRNRINAIAVGGTGLAGYAYDANGNVVSKTLADGTLASYSYDAANRLTTLNHTLGGTSLARFDYGYDNVNRRTFEQRDSGAGDTFSYDAVDQVTGVNYNATNPASGPAGATNAVGYAYDASGNRTTVNDNLGDATAYSANTGNQYTAGGGVSYGYDGNGNLTGGNGTYTYDAQNRLTSVQENTAGVVGSGVYTITCQTSGLALDNPNGGGSGTGVDQQVSSGTNQQWTVTAAGGGAYEIASAVNGLALTGSATSAQLVLQSYTGAANQLWVLAPNGLCKIVRNVGTGQVMDDYGLSTSAGNQVVQWGANGGTNQNWTFTPLASPAVDQFAYDSKNRVVERTVNGTATYFIYDGWDLIEERNGSGTVLATYVHGVRQDEILTRTTSSGTVYYHHNALGSVTDLTNASGTVIEKYRYDAYGNPSITDGSGNLLTTSAYGNRFLFTGREFLAEVNLYDYRNRVYSPDLGRFLQTDPLRFSAGDVNIYRYCGNNPVNLIDGLGESPNWSTVGSGLIQTGGGLLGLAGIAGVEAGSGGLATAAAILAAPGVAGLLANGFADIVGGLAGYDPSTAPTNPLAEAGSIYDGTTGGPTQELGDALNSTLSLGLGSADIASNELNLANGANWLNDDINLTAYLVQNPNPSPPNPPPPNPNPQNQSSGGQCPDSGDDSGGDDDSSDLPSGTLNQTQQHNLPLP